MVLFTWRWQPHWRYIKHLVDTGYIGRPFRARFAFIAGVCLRRRLSQWRFDGRRTTGSRRRSRLAYGRLRPLVSRRRRRRDGRPPNLHRPVGQNRPPPLPVNDACLMMLEMQSGARAEIDVSRVSFLADQVIRLSVQLFGDGGTIEAEHVFFWSSPRNISLAVLDGMPCLTPISSNRLVSGTSSIAFATTGPPSRIFPMVSASRRSSTQRFDQMSRSGESSAMKLGRLVTARPVSLSSTSRAER